MEFLDILSFLLVIGVGMGCGSYATMPYYRLPNDIACAGKWIGKKSACPKCKVQLRTRDLFPVFNWLLTRGKCFKCGNQVTPVYFFIEFSCMMASILLYFKYGFDQMYTITLGMAVCLVILAAQDFTYQIFHDKVLVPLFMFGLLYRVILDGQIYDMILTFAAGVYVSLILAKLYEKKYGKEVKNWSYLKFIPIVGIYFNGWELMYFLGISLVLALIVKLLFLNRKNIPYGLALTLAFFGTLFLSF